MRAGKYQADQAANPEGVAIGIEKPAGGHRQHIQHGPLKSPHNAGEHAVEQTSARVAQLMTLQKRRFVHMKIVPFPARKPPLHCCDAYSNKTFHALRPTVFSARFPAVFVRFFKMQPVHYSETKLNQIHNSLLL